MHRLDSVSRAARLAWRCGRYRRWTAELAVLLLRPEPELPPPKLPPETPLLRPLPCGEPLPEELDPPRRVEEPTELPFRKAPGLPDPVVQVLWLLVNARELAGSLATKSLGWPGRLGWSAPHGRGPGMPPGLPGHWPGPRKREYPPP